jgi:hypothetical protein
MFDVAHWPNAAVATAARPAESSHAHLRIMTVSPRGREARTAKATADRQSTEAIAAPQRPHCHGAAAIPQQQLD